MTDGPQPHVIVLFGARGDLAKRKLLPGLLHLSRSGLARDFIVIGTSRKEMSEDEFRGLARDACTEFGRGATPEELDQFTAALRYVPASVGPQGLRTAVDRAEQDLGGNASVLHYLSTPPSAAPPIIKMIGEAGLAEHARVVMEKPFGTDLASARELNDCVHEVFDDDQVFRIDHFLGKEAAQNILALRFANGLFEPIWNRSHIHHIQIDIPETLSVGERGAYYDEAGAYRDMVVTHLLQVLAFVAMEPPTALAPGPISEEKNKVFRSLRPIDPDEVIRGQYDGYREIEGVAPDSDTETFVALKCHVDSWRWSGVPFFLRTGKRMGEGIRIISIAFREPPQAMFPAGSGVGDFGPDHLTFDLDESAKLSLSFYGKRPGPGMNMQKLSMQFSMAELDERDDTLEAYERLIRDAMQGDATLFTTADGIERLWEVSQPLLDNPPPVRPYEQGSWGPEGIDELVAPNEWRLPFKRRWREAKIGVEG